MRLKVGTKTGIFNLRQNECGTKSRISRKKSSQPSGNHSRSALSCSRLSLVLVCLSSYKSRCAQFHFTHIDAAARLEGTVFQVPTTRKQKVYDAIIIGSGASGGMAAKELTEKGFEVLVLEAGPPVNPQRDFSMHKWPAVSCIHCSFCRQFGGPKPRYISS